MKKHIEFLLNGSRVAVDADARIPLLYVLRDQLGLTGTRFGCGTERCGACMVLVEGKPEYSCAREVGSVAGKAIRTIEGLSGNGAPHPLQDAFVEEQAGQCGYCLPGILMSSLALLEKNLSPKRDEIQRALDPHLCRCGVHNRVVRAVQKAATAMRAARE